ncbi:MAG: helix-turn-helix domain-containing protein [Gemmataceae bacterium]|nr:helix-turn-helix domain-containing protein [Gemmataceae bacterium]
MRAVLPVEEWPQTVGELLATPGNDGRPLSDSYRSARDRVYHQAMRRVTGMTGGLWWEPTASQLSAPDSDALDLAAPLADPGRWFPSPGPNLVAELAAIRAGVEAVRTAVAKDPAPPSPYLDIDQAAEYTRLAKKTLYNHRHEVERVPGIGKLVFTRAALDDWLTTRRKRKR